MTTTNTATLDEQIAKATTTANTKRDEAIAASKKHREATERTAVLATHEDWLVAAAEARAADRDLAALLAGKDA